MQHEDISTEFKSQYTDNIKYTVIAFANSAGGKLYIGVDDDGSICGITDVDDTMLRLTNVIRTAISPDITLFTDCHTETMEGKNVIVLTVMRGTARPYYLYNKGIRPEGVYVRQGASSVPASESAILKMIRETGGDRFEDSRSLNQDLTFDRANAFHERFHVAFGDAQKRTLGLIGQDGTYSNLAMILSDQCLLTIKIAVFDGLRKTAFHNRREFTGSVFQQMEEACDFLENYNQLHAEIQGLFRVEQRDYPPEAIREAVINAVTHRDYTLNGSILISVFDDRMEFVSLGGLVPGMTMEDLKLGVSILRNPKLGNVFYRLELIEAYGTGIMKINEGYADHPVKPTFEVSPNAFKVTLPNLNAKHTQPKPEAVPASPATPVVPALPEDDRRQQILDLFKNHGHIIRKDVQETLAVSQSTAILLLRDMVRLGLLVTAGRGPSLRYLKA